jgi:hypothetical protein
MPEFQHDCERCRFRGQLVGHDIYTCDQGGGGVPPTIVARWGDEGHEYASGPLVQVGPLELRLAPERPAEPIHDPVAVIAAGLLFRLARGSGRVIKDSAQRQHMLRWLDILLSAY